MDSKNSLETKASRTKFGSWEEIVTHVFAAGFLSPFQGVKLVFDQLVVQRRNSKNSLGTEAPPGGNRDACFCGRISLPFQGVL